MEKDHRLKRMETYVKKQFEQDTTGHGFDHMKRVALWSRKLADEEEVDPVLAEAAGWLHDIGDEKLFINPDKAVEERNRLLLEWNFTPFQKNEIEKAIETVSFRKGKKPSSYLGAVVQDADRLDAIGAIGIARAFTYGGAKGQRIDNEEGDASSSIQHFHDKLLKLSGMMNTESGRQEAERRHRFMEEYLLEFKREKQLD
ncbi:HD domain-containing protein [Halobacillus halophilus]|uniref:HD domain-containing protein n=1 Tax=Halobacillus halophilus TaxID=1570 RepID=UPI001CD21BA5|nr:HD domain-containing protein [Halobacillus halophilus]MCA1009411.1 HD domain-containing protein [Halobacillus halophilus]